MKKLIVFLVLAVFFLAGCSNESLSENSNNKSDRTVQIKINKPLNQIEQKKLRSVIFEFLNTCQPLKDKYSEDIEYIEYIDSYTCSKESYFDYRCDSLGWSNMVYLELKIKDNTKSIPSYLRAWGHTEHIYIGGPSNPGFTMTKFPQLCGAPDSGGDDAFISAPQMSELF